MFYTMLVLAHAGLVMDQEENLSPRSSFLLVKENIVYVVISLSYNLKIVWNSSFNEEEHLHQQKTSIQKRS